MRSVPKFHHLAVYFVWLPLALAQPLAKPLADFDKMVSVLKTNGVVAEPIRVGNTTIIPFASVQFGLGSAGAAIGSAGGLGAKTVPLGVVIVEGDDVRVELMPHQEEKPAATMQQLIEAIIDKKLSFMVNGINLGNAPGTVADLVPMVNAMMGEHNILVNGLNLGNLNAPRPPATADNTIRNLEAAVSENPSPEAWYKLGEELRKAGQQEKAAAAYQNALRLRPNYPDAERALAELKK
jgi:uncharacterized spore protein YtfJ